MCCVRLCENAKRCEHERAAEHDDTDFFGFHFCLDISIIPYFCQKVKQNQGFLFKYNVLFF
jgi:hypothetical protein